MANLSLTVRDTLAESARLAQRCGHPEVSVCHVVATICTDVDSPLTQALAAYGVGAPAITAFAQQTIDPQERGGAGQYGVTMMTALTHAALLATKHHSDTISMAMLVDGLLGCADPTFDALLVAADTSSAQLRSELGDWLGVTGDDENLEHDAVDEGRGARSTTDSVPRSLRGFVTDMVAHVTDSPVPAVDRSAITTRVLEVLNRRGKANPVLIGEPGVGKTAIVEQLAAQVATQGFRDMFGDVALWQVDLGSLVAGTRSRGDMEERLKDLLDTVAASERPVWLFIDEIHSLYGAGGSGGDAGAAQALKPALARDGLRLIGASTPKEYRNMLRADGALERRFNVVDVPAPTRDETLAIMRVWAQDLSTHHGLSITDDAVQACVDLTGRWVTDRHWPDKAVDALDTACASASVHASLNGLDDPTIDGQAVAVVVSNMCGVPVTTLTDGEAESLRTLANDLGAKVVGQQQAVTAVCNALRRTRTGLRDMARPASFLFSGPSGVGKTLLASTVAEHMGAGKDALIRIDCSEYSEAHTVARLLGSPPGYVGFDEGGQLTEAVRRNRHAVVLFDEVDKAHPALLDVMLQILDNGALTDSSGTRVDFRSTVVVLTSNAASAAFTSTATGFTNGSKVDGHAAATAGMRPEFVNRLDHVIVFSALTHEDLCRISALMLDQTTSRATARGLHVDVDVDVVPWLAATCVTDGSGARPIRRLIDSEIVDPLSNLILAANRIASSTVRIRVNDAGDGLAVEPVNAPDTVPDAMVNVDQSTPRTTNR